MTRVGWVVLGMVALVVVLFGSMLRFGTLPPRVADAAAPDVSGLSGLLVPVAGVRRDQIVDSWGQARGEGRVHHGTDIPALAGTPVLAATAGTVEKLFQSRLGGTTLYQRSADRHWTYYYAHLAGYAPGIHEGQALRAGDTIGYVGDTGDAGPGNYHLHFSAARLSPEQRWWEGEDVNAWPMLRGR